MAPMLMSPGGRLPSLEHPAAAGPGSLRACGATAVLATAVLVIAAACFEGPRVRLGTLALGYNRRFLGDNGGCHGHGANKRCNTTAPNATDQPSPSGNETSGNCSGAPSEWCKCAESQNECLCNGLVVLGNVDEDMFSDVRRVNGTIFCNYLTLDVSDPAREISPCLLCLLAYLHGGLL